MLFKLSGVWLAAAALVISFAGAGVAQESDSLSRNTAGKSRPTVGIALGGGGTRGAAHVTVLRELVKAGIPIDYIAGTSMGAIVGGLFAAGVELDVLADKFHDRSLMKAFMTVPLSVRLVAAPILILPRLFGRHPYDGLYKGNKFRNYLNHSVPPVDRNIEDLKIPFASVALNLVDGKVYSIRKGNLGYALQASSAVPGLRKPVEIDGKLFVDGGVFANLPVKQVREMGADFVIAVNVDERVKPVPLDDFRKVGSVPKRIVLLQLGEPDVKAGELADLVIHPDVDGISLISTNRKDADSAMNAGTAAVQSALPEIKARLEKLGVSTNVTGQRRKE